MNHFSFLIFTLTYLGELGVLGSMGLSPEFTKHIFPLKGGLVGGSESSKSSSV